MSSQKINSLKKNTIANYVGQIYISFIGIIILPFYLKYLGASAFGLVGFFAVFQTWLRLLDVGLTPTLAREVAHIRGGSKNYNALKELVRTLEILFIIIGLLCFLLVVIFSYTIASSWLKVGTLDIQTVSLCVMLMGAMFGFRWLTDLYGGGLRGFEQQVKYNFISIISVSGQYIGGWMFLHFVSTNILHFFMFQAFVLFLNLLYTMFAFYSVMPITNKIGFTFNTKSFKKIIPFALGISYSSTVWVLVSQSDKLVFSNILPLSKYGYYALLILLSSAVSMVSSPISIAIQPRMTMLLSEGNVKAMESLYLKASVFVIVLVASVVACMCLYSHQLLYVWSGSIALADWGGDILKLYVISSGIIAIIAFQYYLQYAYGKLKLHNLYNTLYLIFVTPLIVYSAYNFGVYDTGMIWLIISLFSLVFWMPIVHHIYARSINVKFFSNLVIILCIAVLMMYVLYILDLQIYNGYLGFVELLIIGGSFLAILSGFVFVLMFLKVVMVR